MHAWHVAAACVMILGRGCSCDRAVERVCVLRVSVSVLSCVYGKGSCVRACVCVWLVCVCVVHVCACPCSSSPPFFL